MGGHRFRYRAALATSCIGVVVFVIGLVSSPGGAGPGAPGGNNGTVKINGDEVKGSDKSNDPHVGCDFTVEFFNYDEGNTFADVSFDGIPPTGGGGLGGGQVFIGGDPAGGSDDHDGTGSYNLLSALSGVTPHPQQGYHVKLTVHAPGSNGADVKHKTFWTLCSPPKATTTTTTTTGPTTTTTAAPTTTTAGVLPTVVTTAPAGAEVLGTHVESERARSLPAELAATGGQQAMWLMTLGAGLVLLGAAARLGARLARDGSVGRR